MSGVFSVFPLESFWPRFWTMLLGPRPDDSVIDLTAISARRIATLSTAVEIASLIRFSTVKTALSTTFLSLSPILFSLTWLWHTLFLPPTRNFPQVIEWLIVRGSKVEFPIALIPVSLPMTKPFKVSFGWLSCFLSWCFFFRVETISCKFLCLTLKKSRTVIKQSIVLNYQSRHVEYLKREPFRQTFISNLPTDH